MKPTAEQKKFILKELIPFVLREQGRGFQMASWKQTIDKGSKTFFSFDLRKDIKTPICNTVACLGGSIQCLRPELRNETAIADAIGLSYDEGDGLFYGWEGTGRVYNWPDRYQKEFTKAKTPLGKAKVAVKLLRRIAREGGGFLKATPPKVKTA